MSKLMSRKRILMYAVSMLVMIAVVPRVSLPQQKIKKLNFLAHLSINFAQKMGSINDYVPGEHDFPVTPSHVEYGGGFDVIYNFSNRLAAQLSFDYLRGAEVEKTDPSDGEVCMYRTYDNWNLLGGGFFRIGKSLPVYISCSGGVNILNPYPVKEAEGSLGSIIIMRPPDTKANPMVAFGGGIILCQKKMVFKIEALYAKVSNYKKDSILLRMGVGF